MRVDGNVAGDDGNGRNGSGDSEISAAWARVKRRLRAELGEDVYASWFARLELEAVDGGTA
ncbi:DnaA N-terminal domain-containing protein, partial [Methylobacterium sp. CCH5-D2]